MVLKVKNTNLIIFILYFLKDSHNFFIRSLSLYTSYLFSMFLNEDIAKIEKPNGISSIAFVVDEFLGLFFHPSIFCVTHSRST